MSTMMAPSLTNAQDLSEYAIGLWGDLPYSDIQAQIGTPNLIADMNAQNLAFTVHAGDLKAGNATVGSITPTTCANEMYIQALGYFNTLQAPAMFTPGDNDWVDCDRPANGGFNSRERLDYERKMFFSTNYSLGQRKLQQAVQTDAFCLNASGLKVGCVENRRWIFGRVTYVTLNLQGSCNNLCDTAPDPAEYTARNAANIAWMKQAFATAKANNSVAVMLITQGNPGWDLNDGFRSAFRNPKTLEELDPKTLTGSNLATLQPIDPKLDGFKDFLVALRSEVVAFRRPVAYVHGDSHYYRIDKPFQDAKGLRLENFTRIETFGNNAANGLNDVQWIKVTVKPNTREVFSYQPQIVPANRVAVPAP